MSAVPAPSPVANAVFDAADSVWDQFPTYLSAVEAAFYNRLHVPARGTIELVRDINKTALANINLIQSLFAIVSVGSALSTLSELMEHISPILPSIESGSDFLNFTANQALPYSALLALVGTVSYVAVNHLMQTKPKDLQDETYLKKSRYQLGSAYIQTARMTLSFAMALLSPNKLPHLANIACLGYSLAKNSELKWLKKTITIPTLFDPLHRKLECVYNMLLLKGRDESDDACAICLGDDPEISICNQDHRIHAECITEMVKQQADSFMRGSRRTRTRVAHYQNGVFTGHSYHWDCTVPASSLPRCPSCLERPKQNSLNLTVDDRQLNRKIQAHVTVTGEGEKSNRALFEKMHAVYSTAGCAISAFSTIPELAPYTYPIRVGMMATDMLACATASYYLVTDLKNKKNTWMIGLACITAATAAVAYPTLNGFFKPSIDLSGFEGVTALDSWYHSLMEAAVYGRFITTAALSLTSKESRLYSVISLTAIAGDFYSLAQMNWVQIETIQAITSHYAKQIKVTSDVLLSSAVTSSRRYLSNAVETIRKTHAHIAEKGTLSLWAVTTNGITSYEFRMAIPEVPESLKPQNFSTLLYRFRSAATIIGGYYNQWGVII